MALALVLALAALLLGLPVLLLALPMTLVFHARIDNGVRGQVRIHWGFVRTRLHFPRRSQPRTTRSTPTARGAQARAVDAPAGDSRRADAPFPHPHGGAWAWRLVRDARWRHAGLRLLRDLAAATHGRDIGVHLRIGLSDPADTGMLWAVLGPLGLSLPKGPHLVRLEPDFSQSGVYGRVHGCVWLRPLRLLWAATRFLLFTRGLRATEASRFGPAHHA